MHGWECQVKPFDLKHSFYSLLDLVHRLTDVCACASAHIPVSRTQTSHCPNGKYDPGITEIQTSPWALLLYVCVWGERAIWPWLGSTAVWGCGERVSVARTKILSSTHTHHAEFNDTTTKPHHFLFLQSKAAIVTARAAVFDARMVKNIKISINLTFKTHVLFDFVLSIKCTKYF